MIVKENDVLGNQHPNTFIGGGSQTMRETDQNKEEFISYVKHLFDIGESENILDNLVNKFNLAGRHTASRRISRYFGRSVYQLREYYKCYGELEIQNPDSFINFLHQEISLLDNVNYGPLVSKGCSKYHINKREFHKRCRSILQTSLSDYIISLFEPTKEEIEKALILSNTSDEFFNTLSIPKGNIRAGFYQRHFGYSTFTAAKATVEFNRDHSIYNPTKDDNLSLIYSQYLGDGSYDLRRNSFKIDHGIKQFEYLKFKVSIFNKAFPETNSVKTIQKKIHNTQNFEFCSWYSKKLPVFRIVSKAEMVEQLTPLGVLLWYLDDGCLYKHSLSIASTDLSVLVALDSKMKSFGINGRVATSCWCLTKLSEIINFLHTFVLPYKHIIPACMKYKLDLKI